MTVSGRPSPAWALALGWLATTCRTPETHGLRTDAAVDLRRSVEASAAADGEQASRTVDGLVPADALSVDAQGSPPGTPVQDASRFDSMAPVQFAALGDTPGYYAGQEAVLSRIVRSLDRRSAFLVHLGDIKGGKSVSTVCDRAMFASVASILRASPRPVFVVPGDNEWVDCTMPLPPVARQLWFQTFGAFETHFATGWTVERGAPDRLDNFAFVVGETLFIGLGMIQGGGTGFDGPAIFRENLQWTVRQLAAATSARAAVIMAQAQINETVNQRFFRQATFQSAAAAFGRPIMYLHGDGHHFACRKEPGWPSNLVRVEVDGGTTANQESTTPLYVTSTGVASDPFLLRRGSAGDDLHTGRCP